MTLSFTRRAFVERAAGAVAAIVVGGCASVAVTPVTPEGGRVRLRLSDYPGLHRPGGWLKIRPAGQAVPLYVLALGGGEYAVLSPVCTHLGCSVNIEGGRLVCPCHGSTYDWAGQVLRGPAERPLVRYPAGVSADGTLTIELEARAP